MKIVVKMDLAQGRGSICWKGVIWRRVWRLSAGAGRKNGFYRRPGMLRSTRTDRPNLSARILLERVATAGAIAAVQPGKAR